jgi:hypothetical protein
MPTYKKLPAIWELKRARKNVLLTPFSLVLLTLRDIIEKLGTSTSTVKAAVSTSRPCTSGCAHFARPEPASFPGRRTNDKASHWSVGWASESLRCFRSPPSCRLTRVLSPWLMRTMEASLNFLHKRMGLNIMQAKTCLLGAIS